MNGSLCVPINALERAFRVAGSSGEHLDEGRASYRVEARLFDEFTREVGLYQMGATEGMAELLGFFEVHGGLLEKIAGG